MGPFEQHGRLNEVVTQFGAKCFQSEVVQATMQPGVSSPYW
jgi:hypothetical protein